MRGKDHGPQIHQNVCPRLAMALLSSARITVVSECVYVCVIAKPLMKATGWQMPTQTCHAVGGRA
eukprot:237911-Pelagomonas_calceolata.AAC.7